VIRQRAFSALAGAFLSLALVLRAPVARADEDPRRVQADGLFQEGLKLHDKDREAEALEKFKKAYDVFPSPNALFWIARTEQLVGRPLDALGHYRTALKNPLLHPGNQQHAKERIAELEKSFGRVTVTGPAGTTVTIGTKEVHLPMDEPLDVEAGPLTVRGERERSRYKGQGLALAGRAIVIELTEASATGTTPTVAQHDPVGDPAPQAAGGTFWTTGRILGVGIAAAGVAAVGVGAGFALTASADGDDLVKLSPFTGPNGENCAGGAKLPQCSDRTRKLDEKDSHESLATGFLIGGGALVVAGAATFLFWPKSSAARAGSMLVPMVGTHGAGLQLRGDF
jgi:hypothetical protein